MKGCSLAVALIVLLLRFPAIAVTQLSILVTTLIRLSQRVSVLEGVVLWRDHYFLVEQDIVLIAFVLSDLERDEPLVFVRDEIWILVFQCISWLLKLGIIELKNVV